MAGRPNPERRSVGRQPPLRVNRAARSSGRAIGAHTGRNGWRERKAGRCKQASGTASALRRCRDYAGNAGFADVVIGLSGGMDSSIVAVMSVDAFGRRPRARRAAARTVLQRTFLRRRTRAGPDNLGIETSVVSICEPYEAFERVLARACGGELAGLAAESTQARCRMVCLMALSNAHGWMLVNTPATRAKTMMGYSTLYGDTAGAFALSAGCTRPTCTIWRAGATAGRVGRCQYPRARARVHESRRAPSSRPTKRTGKAWASTIPHGRFAARAYRARARPQALVADGFDAATVERVLATVRATAFKRALEPPFPDAAFYA